MNRLTQVVASLIATAVAGFTGCTSASKINRTDYRQLRTEQNPQPIANDIKCPSGQTFDAATKKCVTIIVKAPTAEPKAPTVADKPLVTAIDLNAMDAHRTTMTQKIAAATKQKLSDLSQRLWIINEASTNTQNRCQLFFGFDADNFTYTRTYVCKATDSATPLQTQVEFGLINDIRPAANIPIDIMYTQAMASSCVDGTFKAMHPGMIDTFASYFYNQITVDAQSSTGSLEVLNGTTKQTYYRGGAYGLPLDFCADILENFASYSAQPNAASVFLGCQIMTTKAANILKLTNTSCVTKAADGNLKLVDSIMRIFNR